MKNYFFLVAFFATTAMAENPPLAPSNGEVKLRVDAMMCGSCVSKVKKSIESHKGVSDVKVSLDTHEASFVCKIEAECSTAKIQNDLRRIGYPAKSIAPPKE